MNMKLSFKNNELKLSVFIADSFIKRLVGYMFRKKPHYESIVITPCNSIHTFFMRFNIDVLFVNKEGVIIKKVEGLKPYKIIRPVKGSSYVIEVAEGLFTKVRVGDKLIINKT